MGDIAGPFKQLLATPELPGLGPGPRAGVQSEATLRQELTAALADFGLAPERQQLIEALILLWHDHFDASHTISQSIENPDGSFVHAILHRREPDFWNAKYWWRRVGNHPAFPMIAERVAALLKAKGEVRLAQKLVPNGKWDAAAFVDECEAASSSGEAERRQLLAKIQQIETEMVLKYFLEL